MPLELTAETALPYLRQRGWVAGPASVSTLAGGVSNLVLCVEAPEGRFVLKQSRPQLRTRAAWFSDVARIYREQEVMEALAPLLPAGVVPRVLHVDRENYVFTMEHAPLAARPWKELLLRGEVDLSLGRRAGEVLGMIHQETALRPEAMERFAERTVFEQLRIEPFYVRIQERHPDRAAAVQSLIDAMRTARLALCHGDYTPKNLLAGDTDLTLVDYETAHLGEPAMDLGLFFTHLLLKAAHRPAERGRYCNLIETAWAGYASVVSFEAPGELLHRGLAHLGACLLARVDGTSPVDYLNQPGAVEAVRRLGRWVLHERPSRWNEVLDRAANELG